MGTLKLNRNSNGTKNSAEVAEAVKRAGRHVKAAVKKDFAAEALNLAAQCGYTEEQSGLRTANSVVVAGADKDKKMCKIISARPQFYLGEEGDYKKISNSLTDNGGEIVNGENSYKVAFDKDAHSGKIFDLRKGEKIITLSYGNAAQARAHDCGCGCELCADADNKVMATLYDGTQIEYLALNDRIKENIIINSRQEKYEYDFTLQIGDMTVEEGEHSDLLIKDKETGETEFIIPAPYMFDAAGVRSDKVRYEIDVNGGELAIKIIADQSFINSAERAFPVTVDPQIKLTDTKYLSYCTVRSYNDGGENDEFQGELKIEDTYLGYVYCEAILTIYKTNIEKDLDGKVDKVVLNFQAVEYDVGLMTIDGNEFGLGVRNYAFDVTQKYKAGVGAIDIKFEPKLNVNNGVTHSEALFGNIMLVITYTAAEEPESKIKPFIKEIPLVGKATARLDVKRGKAATVVEDCCLSQFPPINVNHIYRQETTPRGCGENWRLNLHRQLKISENDDSNSTKYTYINEYGEKIALEEKYYYINSNGVTVYVSKQNVTADIDGNLTYSGYKVRKRNSAEGYTLIPEINDFKFAGLVETRAQQLIQLEDYVAQTQLSLNDFVIIKKWGLVCKETLREYTDSEFKNFYKSYDLKNDLLMTNKEYKELKKLSDVINSNASNSESVRDEFNDTSGAHERKQKVLIETLRKLVIKQDELARLKAQTPVCFIKDESGEISGFNREGNLVFICDEQGNYASITYDEDKLIKEITGENGVIAKFEYANKLLTSITDAFGGQVIYTYNIDRLTSLTYADGFKHTFTYSNSNGLAEVCTNGGLQAKYSLNDFKRVTKITVRAKDSNITDAPLDSTLSYSKMLSELSISYENGETTLGDKKSNEKFTFNSDGAVTKQLLTDESKRTREITYTYSTPNTEIKTVKKVVKSNVADTEQETIQYDADGKILSKETDFKNISASVKYKTLIDYYYDEYDRIKRKKTAVYYNENNVAKKPIESWVYYHYNAQGQLTLTESFVEGEQKTSGINFEEKVYNDDGNVVKYIRWNSLNSSTKFYEECEVDEKGRVTSEKDEAGEVSAEYAYSGGEINSVKLANGSTLAYGRNPFSGAMTGVTQSTEQGEENATEITYNYGLPVKVQSGNTALEYTYDYTRRKSNVSVNGVTQVSYAYKDYSFNASQRKCTFGEVTATYADGTKVVESRTGTMNFSNVMICTEEYKVNGVTQLSRTINEKNQLTSINDKVSGITNIFRDDYGNITRVSAKTTEAYTYDSYGLLKSKAYSGTVTHAYSYTYKDTAAKELETISVLGYDFKPLTDVNGRNTGKEIYSGANKVAGEYITYRKVGDRATNMPATVWYSTGNKINESIKYKYDKCGNISEIRENGHLKTKYTYDSLNRLIREDNKYCGTTFVFSYDLNGNITERCEYPYTLKRGEELEELECTHYAYDYEGDKLKAYNNETFAYNALGNPTIYRGKTANWLYGKLLANYNGVTFNYNGAGQRISKGNIIFTYDSDGKLIKQSNGLEFIYDASGVAGVLYNGGKYFYRKDAQGNIVALLNSNGEVAVRYEYDAWGNNVVTDKNGNPVTSGIGVLNPFRYRSYYYDTETELYYLQTRYYDPELGRFISQDSIEYADPETINGLNLYAYCANNPVMNIDPTGRSLIAIIILLAIGAVIGGIANGVKASKEGKTGWELVGQIFLGASIGLMVTGGLLMLGATVFGPLGLTFLGATATQMFAIGAVAFNFVPMVVGPILGIKMQGVELKPAPDKPIIPSPPISAYDKKIQHNLDEIIEIYKFSGGLRYDKISRGNLSGM